MLRGLRRVVLAIFLLVPASSLHAQGTVPNGYQVRAGTMLHPGVEHRTLTTATPKAQTVQVAHIAPGAPVAVKAVSAYDAIPNRNAEHELPSDMCRRVACIAGINGDFHYADNDQPIGGVISGGRLLRSPRPGYDQVTLTGDGKLHAGPLGWSGSLDASDGSKVGLTGVNVDRGADGIVLYTPAWGPSTPAGAETELVLRAGTPVGTLGTTSVEIVSSRRSSGGIPADGAVLSATGPAGAALRNLADRLGNGVSPTAQLQLHTALDAVESLGVHPVLLRDGQRVFPQADDGFTRLRNPRTLLGWNASGEIVLVAVDGRRDDASGMSLAEAADLLIGLGATDAVNFDGGGGTTFVVAGEVKNLPSDPGNPGPPAYPDGHEIAPGHVERMAPNGFMIVARAPDPAPPAPPTTTTTSPGPGGAGGSGAPGDPVTDDDLALTGGPRRLQPSIGDVLSSEGDPAFLVGDAGGSRRLVAPAPDERARKGKGKGKRDGSDTVGNLSGDWLPGMPGFPDGAGPGESALPTGPAEDGGPLLDPAFAAAALVASGMVLALLGGIHHVYRSRRTRPVLWL